MKEIKSIIHHDAVEHVDEVSHFELIDGEWTEVIDVRGVEGHDAYDEEVTTYEYDDEDILPEEPTPNEIDVKLLAMENTLMGMFDGLKLVADEDNPILITRLPIIAKVNLFYRYNDEIYVCMNKARSLTSGIVTEENFDDWMVKW